MLRVASVLRSTEIHPNEFRFVTPFFRSLPGHGAFSHRGRQAPRGLPNGANLVGVGHTLGRPRGLQSVLLYLSRCVHSHVSCRPMRVGRGKTVRLNDVSMGVWCEVFHLHVLWFPSVHLLMW